MDDEGRGTGRTTRQMQNTPHGAVYIWPGHGSVSYAKVLAHDLGRSDLEIVNQDVLDRGGERLRGRRLTGVIVDHDCRLTESQRYTWYLLQPFIRTDHALAV